MDRQVSAGRIAGKPDPTNIVGAGLPAMRLRLLQILQNTVASKTKVVWLASIGRIKWSRVLPNLCC
ncbi:hypothetical protein EMIT047CA2_160012 [Pseudomonas soli]